MRHHVEQVTAAAAYLTTAPPALSDNRRRVFCGSNDPTNSLKALKEVVVLRIVFNPTRIHLDENDVTFW